MASRRHQWRKDMDFSLFHVLKKLTLDEELYNTIAGFADEFHQDTRPMQVHSGRMPPAARIRRTLVSTRLRTVPPLLRAGTVVGVQVAESILNPRQHMRDKRALEVDLL